jgi:Rrf2 family protein
MRLGLSKRGDYAVRAVLHLARNEGRGQIKGAEIAEQMDIPLKFLPQIMSTLARDGIVLSTPGARGGYALARPPQEITLLGVIESVEGALAARECVLRGGPCHWDDVCVLHESWRGIQEQLRASLDGVGFAELAARDAALARGAVEVPADSHRRRGRRRA